jgi:hypothetical protein
MRVLCRPAQPVTQEASHADRQPRHLVHVPQEAIAAHGQEGAFADCAGGSRTRLAVDSCHLPDQIVVAVESDGGLFAIRAQLVDADFALIDHIEIAADIGLVKDDLIVGKGAGVKVLHED